MPRPVSAILKTPQDQHHGAFLFDPDQAWREYNELSDLLFSLDEMPEGIAEGCVLAIGTHHGWGEGPNALIDCLKLADFRGHLGLDDVAALRLLARAFAEMGRSENSEFIIAVAGLLSGEHIDLQNLPQGLSINLGTMDDEQRMICYLSKIIPVEFLPMDQIVDRMRTAVEQIPEAEYWRRAEGKKNLRWHLLCGIRARLFKRIERQRIRLFDDSAGGDVSAWRWFCHLETLETSQGLIQYINYRDAAVLRAADGTELFELRNPTVPAECGDTDDFEPVVEAGKYRLMRTEPSGWIAAC